MYLNWYNYSMGTKSHPELKAIMDSYHRGDINDQERRQYMMEKGMQIKTEHRKDFYHWMGAMNGITWMLMFFVIYAVLMQMLWIMPLIFGVLILTMFNIFPFRRNMMKDAILKLTGIRIINMKLPALADYLKVEFIHIPEHYKCEKTE